MLKINSHLLILNWNFDRPLTDCQERFLKGMNKIVCKKSWSLDFTYKTSNDVTDVNKRPQSALSSPKDV